MSKFEPISLARSDYGSPVALNESSGGGLNLYIDNPSVVELPLEGEITFRFKRGPVTLREASSRGPAGATADLTLFEITAVKKGDCCEEESAHEANEIDKLFALARSEESA